MTETYCLHVHENGSGVFLWNFIICLPDCMMLKVMISLSVLPNCLYGACFMLLVYYWPLSSFAGRSNSSYHTDAFISEARWIVFPLNIVQGFLYQLYLCYIVLAREQLNSTVKRYISYGVSLLHCIWSTLSSWNPTPQLWISH